MNFDNNNENNNKNIIIIIIKESKTFIIFGCNAYCEILLLISVGGVIIFIIIIY